MNIEEVSEILKEEVIKNHPEISIIAIYGSAARGQQTDFSDLDMYAVLDNEENAFEIHFTLNNQTVEFWCIPWEWVEKIVSAKEDANPILFPIRTSIFLNNKVIFARSEEDEIRFKNLKKLADIGKKRQIQIASNNFDKLFSFIERVNYANEIDDLLTARWAVWEFIDNTVCILALINYKLLIKNWGSNLHEIFEFDILPDFYKEDILVLATSNDFKEIISTGRRIIREVRKILHSKREEISLDYEEHMKYLDEEYIAFKGYSNKILSACSKRDILAASYAATELQVWMADQLERTETRRTTDIYTFNTYQELKNTYEMLKIPDLSQYITEKDFEKLKEEVEKIDEILIDYFKGKNLELRIFKDVSEVKEFAKTK